MTTAAVPPSTPPRRSDRGRAYGALDLGSNNCRLLVARPGGDSFRVIDAFSRVVRLGEGIALNGRISDPAMRRAVAALEVCARKLARHGVRRLRCVATEACRRAENVDGFRHLVARRTGLSMEVISTEEEGRLALLACAALLDDRPHALIFDIGGGSTEICWIAREADGQPRPLDCLSLPVGVLGLTERHRTRACRQQRFVAMKAEVAGLLADFEHRHGIADAIANDRVQMIGTSGTVTTFCGISLGLRRYRRDRVDGSVLSFAAAEQVTGWLLGASGAERRGHACIGGNRAELMDAGAAIFAAIRELWPVGRLRVADRGLREGILIDLMRADGISIDRGPRCCVALGAAQ